MANDTHTRLEAARERLNAALLAGEDTGPHRTAIKQLEAAADADAQRLAKAAADADQRDAEAIAARAAEITATTLQGIADAAAAFDVEESPATAPITTTTTEEA